ncbi:MAG: hypothetical protein LCH67_00695 [Bacteroidetes bacterium]|nr:hypothetical protein [Bacteroidota bacterium]
MSNHDLFGNPVKAPFLRLENNKAEKHSTLAPEVFSTITQVATIETIAKFKNQSITQVDVYRREKGLAPLNPNKEKNLLSQAGNDNAYNGYLSPSTRRYIEMMMSVWLTAVEINTDIKASKKEVNGEKVFPTFITLTLPCCQLHTDNEIKERILKPFIKWLTFDSGEVYKIGPKKGEKKGFGVSIYFWRAEPQKNTNIHFHLIVDKYVPWEAIRAKWNECLEILGYVSRYAKINKKMAEKFGFTADKAILEKDIMEYKAINDTILNGEPIPDKIPDLFRGYLKVSQKYHRPMSPNMIEQCATDRQKQIFERNLKEGFMNPNSTDIHAIRNLESVTAYVIKYIAKKPTEKALKDNQKLFKDPNTGEIMVRTFDNNYRNSSGEIEPMIVSTEKYIPIYEDRKIYGRIWGCSDTLRGFKPSVEKEVVTDEIGRTFLKEVEAVDENGDITEKLTPVPVMKYFTKKLQERSVWLSSDAQKPNIFVTPPENEDTYTFSYINHLVEVIGKEEIEAISRKVGPQFEKMNGRIIPYRTEKLGYPPKKAQNGKVKPPVVKHVQILKDFAPELHRQYVSYYKHIFDCLYSKAA